jgi:hypothetical protein
MPKQVFADLFPRDRKLGFRMTAPFFRNDEMAGMLIAEAFITQDMLEHYRALSKAEINLFAGENFSLGTLSGQSSLIPEQLARQTACDAISAGTRQIKSASVRVNGHDYYQSGCSLKNDRETLGAITVSL